MSSDPVKSGEDTLQTLGAQFLERHMKREQTAFVVFVGVFMLLLIGIAILFIYNGVVMREQLTSMREEALRARFEAIGSIAEANASSQSQQSAQRSDFVRLRNDSSAARGLLTESLRATREPPATLVQDAARYARAHVLGVPLNESTARLATAALTSSTIASADASLIRMALSDWRGNREGVNAEIPILEGSNAYEGFAHAARAGRLYAAASTDPIDYAWRPAYDDGCLAVAEAVDAAFDTLRPEDYPAGVPGLGLNLLYWKGQCERKNARAEAGYRTYRRAMDIVEAEDVPDTQEFKYQAYHGAGTTLMTLGDGQSDVTGLPEDPLAEAERLLNRAADLRTAWGMTAAGRVGSTENISFIYIRQNRPDRWDKILSHTEQVDQITSQSWNLTARLIAATEKAKTLQPGDLETCDEMRNIAFETGAKLSRRTPGSFDAEELQRLVTVEYAHYVPKAMRWMDYARLGGGDDAALISAPLDGDALATAKAEIANRLINDALNLPCGGG